MMHGHEKSDSVIVAVKPANKAEQPAADRTAAEPTAAELVERRAGTKGNANWQSTRRTQSRVSVSQALERIRQVNAVMTVKSHRTPTPFSRPRTTPLNGAKTGGAEPHIAEQSRSWRAASGEREVMLGS